MGDCNVTVTDGVQSTVVIIPSEKTLAVGKSFALTAVVYPTNMKSQNVIWSSGDTSVVTITNMGVITGVKNGVATITATNCDGVIAYCTVTVGEAAPQATSAPQTADDASGVVPPPTDVHTKVILSEGGGSKNEFSGKVQLKDTSSAVNVRTDRTTKASVVSSLKHGTSVTVLGQYYGKNPDGSINYSEIWDYVRFTDPKDGKVKYGYILASYINPQTPPGTTPKPTATPKPTSTPKPTATPKPGATPDPLSLPVPTSPPNEPPAKEAGLQLYVGKTDENLSKELYTYDQLKQIDQATLNKYMHNYVLQAKTQIGYTEKKEEYKAYIYDPPSDRSHMGIDNRTKYGAWMGDSHVIWCGAFVSWTARCTDGVFLKIIPDYVTVTNGKKYYSDKKRLVQSDGKFVPHEGDVIFIQHTSGQWHTGLVIYADNKVVETIEGNTSDPANTMKPEGFIVYYKQYPLNASFIKAYGINGSTSSGTQVTICGLETLNDPGARH